MNSYEPAQLHPTKLKFRSYLFPHNRTKPRLLKVFDKDLSRHTLIPSLRQGTLDAMSILWPRDHCFESARVDRVFNQRRPVRHPLAIVKASSHDDVRKAIELAKELKCNVSVRSGGHSWAGWSIRDDSVLVDLGGLNAISFDETTGIVKAGPAVTADELNSVLVGKNRIFNGPHCPSVGLGGFL